MNYLNDLRFIMRQLPSERKELVESCAYTNDFEAAIECLRHSPSVEKAEVLNMAKHCMLKDVNLIRKKK